MADNNILALFSRKQAEYHVLIKVIDVLAHVNKISFRLKELLGSDSFSWTEKLNLKAMFGGDYSRVIAFGIDFSFINGEWVGHKTDYAHMYATKILSRLQNHDNYYLGAIVYADDLHLIEVLMRQWNEIFKNEFGFGLDEEEFLYDINDEMLIFISNELKEKIEKQSQLDYDFVRAFLESFYEYDEFLVMNKVKEEYL
jgi:hypothetical protein